MAKGPGDKVSNNVNRWTRQPKLDLSFERHILDLYKSEKEREKQESVEKEAKRRSFIAEKSKQKQPIPTASVGPSGGVSPQTNGPSRMNSAHIEVLSRFHIDYNEFEQGLPPPDPFDAPKTIQQELQEVMQASRASRESAATPFSTAYASMAPPLPAPLHSQSGFTSQPAAFPTPNFITSSPSSSSSLFSSPGYNYYRPTVQSTSQPPPPLPPKVQAQSTELDELTAKLLSMDLTDDQISSALRASNGNEQIVRLSLVFSASPMLTLPFSTLQGNLICPTLATPSKEKLFSRQH